MRRIWEIISRYQDWGWRYFFVDLYEYAIKYRYKQYVPGQLAMEKLVEDYDFTTVLDVGCGNGAASKYFTDRGKIVTACDYGRSVHFEDTMAENVVIGDFNQLEFEETFDCIWCSHVLEHQLNIQDFLERIHALLREGGVLAITVPPLKHEIEGGHVSLWNQGMLLYRLILAGFDCSEARVGKYGYNISVIVRKKTISVKKNLTYDRGDLLLLQQFFPDCIKVRKTDKDISFNGKKLKNW